MDDSYDLQRFLDAQAPIFEQMRTELRAGRKASHWMWFIFPQIQGLGSSSMALRYAICSLQEAEAYLRHPTLGARLIECTRLVLAADAASAVEIFGGIDAMKFRSSMTLFACAAPDNSVFREALDKYFGSQPDPLTLARL